MTNMESLISRIGRCYPSLSKGQRRIADFISESCEDAAFMTAAKLGESTDVSESTVVRFAYAIGFDGYPALAGAMQDMIRRRLTSADRIRLTGNLAKDDVLHTVLTSDMNNIRRTIDMIDNASFSGAIAAMLDARRIYVLGTRSAAPLAQFFSYYLDYVRDNVVFVNGAMQDMYECMLRADETDVCFAISFPRYSTRTLDAMQFAKSKGMAVIALTDQTNSPLAERADYTLLAHSSMASFADSLVAPMSMLNAIIVAIGLARREEAYWHLSQLEQVWRTRGVYVTDEGKGSL